MAQTLQVTGIAQETEFNDETKSVTTLLVLNKGTFRIPVDSKEAERIIAYMYGRTDNRDTDAKDIVSEVDESDGDIDESEDEDGVDQI